MEMTLWSLLHEVNNLGGSCNYPSTYMRNNSASLYALGDIA